MVPRTFKISGIFPLNKRVFIVKKGENVHHFKTRELITFEKPKTVLQLHRCKNTLSFKECAVAVRGDAMCLLGCLLSGTMKKKPTPVSLTFYNLNVFKK